MAIWANVAITDKEVTKSKFFETIQLIVSSVNEHRTRFGTEENISPEKSLVNQLQSDSRLTLILIWFFMNPESYIPDSEKPFLKWSIPTTELELDHRGAFRAISDNHALYEGGESKSSIKNGITFSANC